MLGDIDEQVQEYLQLYRKKGCIVNTAACVTASIQLIERSSLAYFKLIDIENRSWATSLFRRMGFIKIAVTSGRPEIIEGARKEAEVLFHHQIVEFVEEHNIPPSVILNFDQTSLTYAPVASEMLLR